MPTFLIWRTPSALNYARTLVGNLCMPFTSSTYKSARRSFQALRLANFLLRPSLDIVQSLLILGNTLQNNGQSDAAWALLGTTVRLAQTLGLHTERGISHWPEHAKQKAKLLWYASSLTVRTV